MVRSGHRPHALRRALLVVGALVTASLAAGCGEEQSEQRTGAILQGEIVVAGPGVTDSMTAAVSGVISRVGSCIGLDDSPVIWPYGTTWDAATSTLSFDVEGGYSAQLGQYVQGGGGTVPLRSFPPGADSSADALAECGARPGDQVQIFGPDPSVAPTFPPPLPAAPPPSPPAPTP